MNSLNQSRRDFLQKLSNASLVLPLGPLSSISDLWLPGKQEYHFSQPNVKAPSSLLKPNESMLNGFQAVAWYTPLSGVIAQPNYAEASVTTNSPLFKESPEKITTIQFQQWWGRGKGIKAWDGTKYGYNVNDVKVSFGAMIKLPQSTGNATRYATFYLRAEQINKPSPKNAYWIQVSIYDNRGYNPGNQDNLYYDVNLTDEPALESQLGKSKFSSKIPDSLTMQFSAFSDFKFFGASISRQQLFDLLTAFKAKGADLDPEPNLHRIFAFGVTPEIAKGDLGGNMKMGVKNLFLRTDY